jgi:Flp pilus assembly protein TadB
MADALLLGIGSASAGGLAAWLWAPADRWFRDAAVRDAPELKAEMDAAGMDPARLAYWLLAWRGLAAGVLVGVWAGLGMAPVAITLAVIIYKTGPHWVRARISAHRRRTNEQVAGAARNLAGQVRVGLPLADALTDVSRQTPEPLGGHLRRTAGQVAQGTDLRSALADLKARVRVDAVTALAVALQVATERGGKLADVLDRIARSAEELARVERKREADTAAGRLMVRLLGAFPVAFLGFFYFMDPTLIVGLGRSLVGQFVLAAVAVIVYAATRWAARILARVE